MLIMEEYVIAIIDDGVMVSEVLSREQDWKFRMR